MSIMKDFFEEYHDKVEQLKTENEYLCEDNTRLGNNLDYVNEKLNKYKSALEAIKNIANEAINSNDQYIRMYAGKMYCNQIIKTIDEVLNG